MFLSKNYVLASELVQAMGIALHSVCNMRQDFEYSDDKYSIRTMNNCMLINKKAYHLPNNIKQGIKKHEHKLTDLSNKLPCTWVKAQYGVSESLLMRSGIVIDKITIAKNRRFYVFNDEFVKLMKNRIPYILDAKEMEKCAAEGSIAGSIKLNSNKFFTWY